MVKKSGFGAMGGFSFGTSKQTDSLDSKKVFHNASTVGSVEGDVLINAGNALNITGSNVIARQGDITLIGKEVNIGAALDTTQEREFHEIKQTGLTLTASNPIVSAVQTGVRMADAAGKSDNAVMQGLAGVTTGLAAVNAYDAVQASSKAAAAAEAAKPGSSNQIDKLGGVSIKLSLGTSKSSSTTDRNASNAFGSTVAAGKDLTIVAQGAGQDSDITVTGSTLSAGNNAVLKAEGDILLEAARNAFEQKTTSKSSSASIGIGYSTGGEQNGWTLELGASVGRGNANGKDESWTNTNVTAGNVLAIQSGGDTTLKGAAAKADQIIASVGGNLLLESLQDSSKYDSKNKSAGFGLTLCIPPYCAGSSSVSANASTGKMNSNFKTVTEQTGLWAGDGGFLIDVKNNTTLIGSVIASSDKAVADGLNKLTTGTLVTEDLKNTARYSGSQVSIGGGFGFGGAKASDSGLGTTKGGEVAGGASKDAGTSISTGSSGFGMGTPIVVAASGNSSSTTQSGISGGTIVIRDEAAQVALTGKTAAETIATLNRDTSDTLNALKPIFDKEKIEAGFEIASEAQRQMGQFLTNRAKEKQAAEKALADAVKNGKAIDAAQMTALLDQLQHAQDWSAGGKYGLILVALSGAAGANVTGSTSAFVQSAAVNYLQGMAASQVKQIADLLGTGNEAEGARAALHGILGCAGAAGKGAACASGALGAGAGSILNSLMGSAEGLTPEQVEARRNMVTSLVAGIAAAAGGDPATAGMAATLETSQNWGFLAPVAAAAAAKCATTTSCQRVVTVVSEKSTTLWMQTKDGVTYVVTAAMSGIAAGALGPWAAELVSDIAGKEAALPGKPGSVVHLTALPPSIGDEGRYGPEIPVVPGRPVEPIAVPGQENNGPIGGTTISSPLPDEEGPVLIYSQGLPPGKISDVPIYDPSGAARAAEHSGNWSSGSLKETVRNVVGENPKVEYTTSGKTVFTNAMTGVSVVLDNAGNYYRVQNSAGQYLDQNGNAIPHNVPLVGVEKTTQTGIPSGVRNGLTHFKNSD
ncbi:hemagglutinin repeat-containing protein [Achromobacter sp.]|uniref:hemagglutinin repeat-containing protein n=1 Tax=Achromobacter sp. TaxID=134375 RepID=UPI0028B15E6F|nr:hemagglutinin repeat-containing protein [Achromobacter sp.]